MLKGGFTLLFSFLVVCVSAQGIQKEIPLGTNSSKFGYLEYLPPSYESGSSFPLIVYLHGIREAGNGTSDLYKVKANGPPKHISLGEWPIKNPQGSDPAKEFIVISPQSASATPTPVSIHEFIDFLKSHYKVDQNRIYITGISAGAVALWQYLATYSDQVAAAIPIAGSANGYLDKLCISKDIATWAFHYEGDQTIGSGGSISATNTLKNCSPTGKNPHLVTIYNGNDHHAWHYTYDNAWIDVPWINSNYDPFSISIYDWLLSYSRGANQEVNQAPTVNAGTDKNIQLPTNSLVLSGSANDPDGNIDVYHWSKQSGPTVTIQDQYSANTTVSNLLQGTYVFRFWAKDNDGAAAYDDVTVNVQEQDGVNQAPTVSAGTDKTIQLPINSLVLSGTASDSDGNIVVNLWSKQSGPTATIQDQYSANTTVSNLLQGTYVFRFWAKDNDGDAAYDDVTVNVQEQDGVNQAPTVSAGTDKTIQLPTNSLVLSGTASDSDGNIEVNRWSKQSGPTATIQDQYSANTTVSNLLQGTYVFRFWAKDNDGDAAYDDVTVNVQEQDGVNQAPTVSAGTDKTIQLPTNSLVLSGTASDSDGNIEVNRWSKQSGPIATIQDQYSTNTTVSNLLQGTYVFRFWAKDNDGAAAYDDVTVNVQEQDGVNQAPTVSAGTDKTIQLPTNSLVLSGTASDPDGNIEVNRWSKQSGPTVTIQDQYSANTTVSNLLQGTYVFRFWAKDNDGDAAYDDVTVNVLGQVGVNQAPTVNAGTDKTIQLPTNSLVLSGTASDPDGNIEVNRWSKQSGPTVTIQDQYSANTTVSNLLQGTYVFRFWAKDNDGDAAYDDVTVIVQSSSNSMARESAKGEDINSFEKLLEKPIIYPIPTNDILHVHVPLDLNPEYSNLKLSIYNLNGVEILNRRLETGIINDVDISQLRGNVYIYTIKYGENIVVRDKLIKN